MEITGAIGIEKELELMESASNILPREGSYMIKNWRSVEIESVAKYYDLIDINLEEIRYK